MAGKGTAYLQQLLQSKDDDSQFSSDDKIEIEEEEEEEVESLLTTTAKTPRSRGKVSKKQLKEYVNLLKTMADQYPRHESPKVKKEYLLEFAMSHPPAKKPRVKKEVPNVKNACTFFRSDQCYKYKGLSFTEMTQKLGTYPNYSF